MKLEDFLKSKGILKSEEFGDYQDSIEEWERNYFKNKKGLTTNNIDQQFREQNEI